MSFAIQVILGIILGLIAYGLSQIVFAHWISVLIGLVVALAVIFGDRVIRR